MQLQLRNLKKNKTGMVRIITYLVSYFLEPLEKDRERVATRNNKFVW